MSLSFHRPFKAQAAFERLGLTLRREPQASLVAVTIMPAGKDGAETTFTSHATAEEVLIAATHLLQAARASLGREPDPDGSLIKQIDAALRALPVEYTEVSAEARH
ncbi:hypothetical protein [Lichenihabitans psoromatis]|uniref:hypothetical protein n=1 Tax=Lichenihabitans psoromatis TaxID=2528642 RepID=UPI0013F151B0|nr:hypothetical protein [Lichenihabitans psoromatis]